MSTTATEPRAVPSDRVAVTQVPLHPLLASRWSTRALDDAAAVADDDLLAILEAARWAPSANNRQAWRFVLARRGEANFAAITSSLKGFNNDWAPKASALIVAVAEIGDDPTVIGKSAYDLGGAVAHFSIQAQALGWSTHQMGGFDRAILTDALQLPTGFVPMTVTAIGRHAASADLPEGLSAREKAPRVRRPLTETVFGDWGTAHPVVS